ncbi:GGDEF domain-containing protein [Bacterioplanoides sp. SCSIO 12839]|uniref:GGDEF domain-containing protein n=1 Tax=Bacterioplanoides sp. SCSIO 12839 TaxID=2829569 RepID=UPI002103FAB9|nr:GGDEF domain-containing protein [Bacterioplanoides sp. SCSIO 12839]UTW48975.1 GGDEF domain-containing protein [Bacterioplanoides sp. SCSIO 12839]
MEQLHRDIIRRHTQASAAALLFSVLFSISYLFGLTPLALHELIFLLMSYWCVHGFLLYLVISGRSKRYQDPSLMIPFMLAGISFITLMLINSDVLRPVWTMAYLAVMPFGVFRLSWKEYLCICLFVLACYSGVLSYFHVYELSVWSLEMELLAGLAFLACIMAYTVIGKEFSILRDAYRQKNRELRRALVKIEELAITDELTGLFNRRYLLKMLDKQQALSNREGLPFVLAFVDIDHFKQINDIHGHRVGDQVLTELSLLLKDAVREVDVAARYGGEEFVLLLSGVNLDAGRTALERIRMQVSEQRYTDMNIPLTVSVGVVEHHLNEGAEVMLNRADRLLYEAKRGGRNRVKAEPQELSLFSEEAL